MRLINADELKKQFEDRTLEDFTCFHFIEAIDNAPTVTKDNRPNICFNCEHCCALTINSDGEVGVMCNLGAENCDNERPIEKCANCDYRKFTETFINGVVEVMNKNGITSVEQLSEILKEAENEIN